MDDGAKLVQLRTRRSEPRLWRDADEFVHGLAQGGVEFPEEGAPDGWSRRTFMKLLGASVALATLDGCDRTVPEEIVPYSVRPTDVQPGVARFYATAAMLDGFASGLLVECHEGRPTKVEGNPDHPASRGATTMFEQALVLGLYDPDRLRGVEHDGAPSTWEALAERLRRPRTDGGAGLRLLLEPTTSPTVLRLIERVRQLHPALGVTFQSAMSALPNTVAGARVAFGSDLQPIYDFARRRRDRGARRRSAVRRADGAGLRARLGVTTAHRRAVRDAEPALRRRVRAVGDRDVRRPSAAPALGGDRRRLARHRRRDSVAAGGGALRRASPRSLQPRGRARSGSASGRDHARRRRRAPAAGGARARLRHQRRARQRRAHAALRRRAVARQRRRRRRARRRAARRQGRHAHHPRRQSRLRRAGRSRAGAGDGARGRSRLRGRCTPTRPRARRRGSRRWRTSSSRGATGARTTARCRSSSRSCSRCTADARRPRSWRSSPASGSPKRAAWCSTRTTGNSTSTPRSPPASCPIAPHRRSLRTRPTPAPSRARSPSCRAPSAAPSRSTSAARRRCTTAASPTTRGCSSNRSRSRS